MRVDVFEMVKQNSSRATENITILSESNGFRETEQRFGR